MISIKAVPYQVNEGAESLCQGPPYFAWLFGKKLRISKGVDLI